MNIITISHIDELQEIINHQNCMNGIMQDEIEENMWCISIEENCISDFTVDSFLQFFNTLMVEKARQIRLFDQHKQATLYVWFDKQALQLRFNILSGVVLELPFQCQLRKVSSVASIIEDFLNTVRRFAQHGDTVEFLELDSSGFDADDEDDFVLDVYVAILNTAQLNAYSKK